MTGLPRRAMSSRQGLLDGVLPVWQQPCELADCDPSLHLNPSLLHIQFTPHSYLLSPFEHRGARPPHSYLLSPFEQMGARPKSSATWDMRQAVYPSIASASRSW